MTWVYRSLCGLFLASYWAFYGHAISWRLPATGLLIFAVVAISDAGTMVFIVLYPVLLYLNQYPQQQFSAATFLVVSLALGLSFRRSAQLWIPLTIVLFYFGISAVRYQPDWPSILQGVWTTEQMSPTLFVGTCVMWTAGIMLFDFLRRMKVRSLYYGLIAQGSVFAAMAVANIWLRKKPLVVYQFLFGDVHAFAAYLILQIGLLAGVWKDQRKLAGWAAVSILFAVDSLLLVASYSRSGLAAYFAVIFVYIMALIVVWIYRQNWRKLGAVVLAVLVILGAVATYGPSQLIAKADGLYKKLEPIVPGALNRELAPRVADLHSQFNTRIYGITPKVLYLERVLDWTVPLIVIGDYPVFGIGVGEFFRNSRAYAKRAHRDVVGDFFSYYEPANAHNYYLQMAAEAGLVGLTLFLGFLGWLFSKHLSLTDPLKLGCGMAVVGLMIFSVAQHPLLVDRVFFVFVMICAAFAGSGPGDKTGA